MFPHECFGNSSSANDEMKQKHPPIKEQRLPAVGHEADRGGRAVVDVNACRDLIKSYAEEVEGSGAEKESNGAEKGGENNGGRGFGEGQGELHSNTSIDRQHRAGREKCEAHHPMSRADARDVGRSNTAAAVGVLVRR